MGKLLLLIVFALSFPQLPLYSSNQITYFVHGLAEARVGFLNHDWFAHTTDPYPVFSALVGVTEHLLGEKAFYFFFMIILAIYGYSILGIASEVFNIGNTSAKYLAYFALLTMLDSGLFLHLISKFHSLSSLAPIFEPNGLLTRGVAEQSILGQIFQPSVFGVFLVLSIFFFLREKPFIAVFCLVIAATIHASSLLSAAVLTCTYGLIILVKDKDYRKALLLGATSLLLLTPTILYVYLNFRPTTPVIFAQSQSILVDYRIPRHAVVTTWFGLSAVFQIMIVTLAIYLVRHSKIFPILLSAFLVSGILTVVQILTGNKTLALLFPWRISTFLVPIASSLILAKIVSLVFQNLNGRLSKLVAPLQVVISIVIIMLSYWGVRQTMTLLNTPRAGLTDSTRFIANTYQPDHLYLIPPDMESFRLAAKVPVFVEYKSSPYKDTDVAEWYQRLKNANAFYASGGKAACNMLDDLVDRYRITDVILKRGSSIANCALLNEVYKDSNLVVFAVHDDDEERIDPGIR
jgi:hypothetical protein